MLHLSQTALSDQLQIGHASHPGRSGKNNEDYYGVFSVATSGGECVVAAVADGIGGSVGGEQASRLTIDTMAGFLKDNRYLATSPGQRLDQAIRLANRAVYDKALDEPALLGMGTTIVAVALDGDRLYVVHAGDSRAYLVRGGRAHQLTLDHSWAQEAIEAGRITPEAAKTHPNRHVIRRYLGINEDVDTDPRVVDPSQAAANMERPVTVISPIPTQLGDAIVLCTDGLTDEIGDDEIAKIVSRHSPEEAARRLVDAANAAGGADNITVVILQRGKGGGAAAAGGRSRLVALGLAAMAVLLVGALGWLLASGALFGGGADGEIVAKAAATVTDSSAVIVQADTPAPSDTATDAPTEIATEISPTAAVTLQPEDAGKPTPQAAAGVTAVSTTASAPITPTAGVTTTPSITATGFLTEEQPPSQTSTPVAGPGKGISGAPTEVSPVTEDVTQRLEGTATIELSPTAATVATRTEVPTATPSSTVKPTSTPAQRGTPTFTVTPTLVRSTSTPRVGPRSQPVQALTATLSPPIGSPPALATAETGSEEGGPTGIYDVSPADGQNFNAQDVIKFAWTANAPLLANQVYEVAFWDPTKEQVADSRARSAASKDPFLTLRWDDQSAPGTFRWTVWLRNAEPNNHRIRQLGTYTITISGGSSGGSGGDSGGDTGGNGDPAGRP